MRFKFGVFPALLFVAVATASAAHADFIGGSLITPTTTLASDSGFTVNQIADGITSDAPPFNGFVSNSASGTITLTLDQNYTLSQFYLWNDINVQQEGVNQFRLDFFGANRTPLSSSSVYTGPLGQVAPEIYTFSDVANVRSVDFVVLSTYVFQGTANRIEVREVGFTGFASASAAPEPGSIALLLTAGLPVVGIIRRRKRA